MALREINLIPEDIMSSRYTLRHIQLWAVCLTLILLLIGGLFQYQSSFIINKNYPGKNLDDIYTLLGVRTEALNRIQVELEKLDQQQSMLGDIKKNQPYSLVLSKLANVMNEDTWLISLSIDSMVTNYKGEEEISITGYSSSNEKLGNFINRLSGTPIFKDVHLRYARETSKAILNSNQYKNVRLIEFQIQSKMHNQQTREGQIGAE